MLRDKLSHFEHRDLFLSTKNRFEVSICIDVSSVFRILKIFGYHCTVHSHTIILDLCYAALLRSQNDKHKKKRNKFQHGNGI